MAVRPRGNKAGERSPRALIIQLDLLTHTLGQLTLPEFFNTLIFDRFLPDIRIESLRGAFSLHLPSALSSPLLRIPSHGQLFFSERMRAHRGGAGAVGIRAGSAILYRAFTTGEISRGYAKLDKV